MNPDIRVHIDRLVMDGSSLDGQDPKKVAEEVRGTLEALLTDHGITGDLAPGGVRGTIHGGNLTEVGDLGPQVARAIHHGLSGRSGGTAMTESGPATGVARVVTAQPSRVAPDVALKGRPRAGGQGEHP